MWVYPCRDAQTPTCTNTAPHEHAHKHLRVLSEWVPILPGAKRTQAISPGGPMGGTEPFTVEYKSRGYWVLFLMQIKSSDLWGLSLLV